MIGGFFDRHHGEWDEAALEWFERTQGARRIVCMSSPGNEPSLRMAAKFGFSPMRDTTLPDGEPLQLTDDNALRARATRMEAERLLTSREITSGHDAIAALDLLLQAPQDQQGVVIDKLSQRAFENLVDRLSDDQRVRLTPLVDASQSPQRKLRLWAAQHKSRARSDLQRYAGNFGDEDDQTDAQAAAAQRYHRRETGVTCTADGCFSRYAALYFTVLSQRTVRSGTAVARGGTCSPPNSQALKRQKVATIRKITMLCGR